MNYRAIGTASALGLAVAAAALPGRSAPAEDAAPFAKLRLPKNAALNVSPDQLARAVDDIDRGERKLAVNGEKTRGPAAIVYPKVAPAVVLVQTTAGHGTGEFISADGWLITNHHVIDSASLDAATGARTADIYIGRFDGEQMRLIEEPIRALVYKSSTQKDLALLKLTALPKGMKEVPFLAIADKSPKPGGACVSIGHPGSGLMWTVRSGEVAGYGEWPKDSGAFTAGRLSLDGADRDRAKTVLNNHPARRKVLLSNCGVAPGDSGGPLVNEDGKLIAVTYACPAEEGRGSANFAFHVHLDEVKAFIADKPEKPTVVLPDPWPAGVFSDLLDIDKDGKPETLVFGLTRGGAPTGLLIDLKQASDKAFTTADLSDPEKRKRWKFQFAMHMAPVRRVFYDTTGDGEIDLILQAKPGKETADVVYRREGKVWKAEPGKGRSLVDPSLFKNRELGTRLTAILRAVAAS